MKTGIETGEDAGTMIPCAEMIAGFIAESSSEHPDTVWMFARRAFIDTLGCMYLGATHPDTETVLKTVQGWGTGNSRLYGRQERLPAPWAALVNATSAHAFDFDDWEDPGITHPSAAIFPALLACAEEDMTFGALLDAWIVGVEVIMRIGEAVNMTHYEMGWHTTNTLGAIGAAAACARLMGLDRDQSRHTVSLATSMAGGFTSQFGTTAKPLHAGLAAKTGVMSSALASNAATGAEKVFEASAGFLATMTKASPAALAARLADLGTSYAIVQHGMHIKKYPSCGCTHLVIEACQKIRQESQLAPRDILRVETTISDIALSILPYGVPDNRTEALFSVPWCAAVALIDGSVDIQAFEPEALQRNDLRDLASRITVSEHPRADGVAFHPSFPDVVIVHLRDGRALTHQISFPAGSPPRPLANEDLEEKFCTCAARSGLSKESCEVWFSKLLVEPLESTVNEILSPDVR